jgi:hypothetical protein
MSDEWRSSQFDSQEQEPLGPLANLIDIMLVFSCGLIAALVALSPELEQHFQITNQHTSQISNQNTSQNANQSTSQVLAQDALKEASAKIQPISTLGKELTSPPETLQQKLQSQEGYQSMGQVYKDPKTGKLILISND